MLSKKMCICFVPLPSKLILSSDSMSVFIERMCHIKARENHLLNYSLTWSKSILSLVSAGEAQVAQEERLQWFMPLTGQSEGG